MTQNLLHVPLCPQTLLRAFVQDFENEILCFWGDFDFLREFDLTLLNEFEHETLRLVVERR